MQAFTKTTWEEIYLAHEFRRLDGKGWIGDGEIINSATITTTDKISGAAVGGIVNNVQPSGTQVIYQVAGGTIGAKYIADIKVVTSRGQKFEDRVELRITA